MRVFVGFVFGFNLYLAVVDEGLQVERFFERVVGNSDHLHRLAVYRLDVKHIAVPSKNGVALQVQVRHQVGIGVGIVLTAPAHLVLTILQQVKHGGFVGEFGIDRQGLDGHS